MSRSGAGGSSADSSQSGKHDRAVASSLDWADQAARKGDFAEALAWLDMLDSIGEPLPESYAAKHAQWLSALGTAR